MFDVRTWVALSMSVITPACGAGTVNISQGESALGKTQDENATYDLRQPDATIACRRDGRMVSSIVADRPFDILGTGFRKGLVVQVCIPTDNSPGSGCLPNEVDRTGSFVQSRSVGLPAGDFPVTVVQARNSTLVTFDAVISDQISVN